MKPTKYEPKKLLEDMEIDQIVTLQMKHRPSITSAITRLHHGPKVFTSRKVNSKEFTVRRVR